YAVTHTINMTNTAGVTLAGCAGTNFNVGNIFPGSASNTTTILCNTAASNPDCLETIGSSNFVLRNLSLSSIGQASASINILVMGRDSATSPGSGNQFCFSQFWELNNIYVVAAHNQAANGGAGSTGIYNIGAEDGTIIASVFDADENRFSTANDLA